MSGYADAYRKLMIAYANVVPMYRVIAYALNDPSTLRTKMIQAYLVLDMRVEFCQESCTESFRRYKGQCRDVQRALQVIEELHTPEADEVKLNLHKLREAIEEAKRMSPQVRAQVGNVGVPAFRRQTMRF